MSVFTVDTDAVQAANGAAYATMERLQNQLQSSWTGAAAAAFQQCSEQWRGAQMHVEQVLGSISAALGSAAAQYADADQYSASLFR